ncbi:MAG: DUF6514 family protein [Clostridiales bacterium]|nr:DUF6514 family protein [Clostridiales bacterium]
MLLEKTKNVLMLVDEGGEKHLLHYELLVDEIITENRIGLETYGVSVSKFSDDELYEVEKAEFRDISTDRRKIDDFLANLIQHNVTPISLPYIVEDFLSC